MSPAGPPSPRTGQEPHVSESPGDIIKDAGEQAPPRNLNVGSRGVTELPPSERVTPRDSEACFGLKGPGLGFRVSERSKALPRRSGLSSTRGRWEGERTGAQAHGGGCSEKAVYCLLILYRGTERSYKYSIGCHWQCYFWSQFLFCFSSEGNRTVKVHFRLQSTAASPASLIQSQHDRLPPHPPTNHRNGNIYRDVTHPEWAAKAENSINNLHSLKSCIRHNIFWNPCVILTLLSQELERRKECSRTPQRTDLFLLARIGDHRIGVGAAQLNGSDQALPGGFSVRKDWLQNQGPGLDASLPASSQHWEAPAVIKDGAYQLSLSTLGQLRSSFILRAVSVTLMS